MWYAYGASSAGCMGPSPPLVLGGELQQLPDGWLPDHNMWRPQPQVHLAGLGDGRHPIQSLHRRHKGASENRCAETM